MQEPLAFPKPTSSPIAAVSIDSGGMFQPCFIVTASPHQLHLPWRLDQLAIPIVVSDGSRISLLRERWSRYARLSPLECAVLTFVLDSWPRAAIARELGIRTERQVSTHLDRIRSKLGTETLVELIKFGVSIGITGLFDE